MDSQVSTSEHGTQYWVLKYLSTALKTLDQCAVTVLFMEVNKTVPPYLLFVTAKIAMNR